LRKWLLACLLLSLSAAAVVLAQSGAATETPEPTSLPECNDAEAVSLYVADLSGQLADLQDRLSEDDSALADVYTVGLAYQELALSCGYLPANFDALVINTTDLTRVLPALEQLYGDPGRGQLLYDGEELTTSGDKLGCLGCHQAGLIAPPTAGTWTRWDEEHSLDPLFADYDFTHYMAESILLPWAYFVPTWPEYTMPDFYPDQLSYQDLADLIAYLESQDQLP
jgi:mono/diheme cytochrome c family protein